MNIKISLARTDDALALAEMSRTLIENGLPWSWTEHRVRHQILHADSAVIVARDRRRLAGFACMQFFDEHAHLNLLAVKSGYRRQGIGSELVYWLEACARTAGLFTVILEIRSANANAREFYQSLGFADAGVRECYYAGRENAHRMTHDLRLLPASPA